MPEIEHPYFTHYQSGQELVLLPEKAIFWREKSTLLIADLHLGKAGHFRKAGIPVSSKIHQHDLQTLEALLESWQAQQVIFLGDLFHSSYNSEWEAFENLMERHKTVRFILIKGNHDILSEAVYRESRLQIKEDKMMISPFLLTHHPPEAPPQESLAYTLCGHVHPAVQLKGAGRQTLSLPCFYFGLHHALLPAFGKFTGFHKIKPKAGEQVFGILPERVVPIGLS